MSYSDGFNGSGAPDYNSESWRAGNIARQNDQQFQQQQLLRRQQEQQRLATEQQRAQRLATEQQEQQAKRQRMAINISTNNTEYERPNTPYSVSSDNIPYVESSIKSSGFFSLLFTLCAIGGFVFAGLAGIQELMQKNSQVNNLVLQNFDKYIGIESIMSIDTITLVSGSLLIVTGYFLRSFLRVILAGSILVLLAFFILSHMTGVPDISYGSLLSL